jgi:hypothetical protein
MTHLILVLLVGYIISGTMAFFFTPSGDPITMLVSTLPLYVVLEVFY